MLDFETCVRTRHAILMEGALGERLKREYHLVFDEQVAMARLVEREEGRRALCSLWTEYAEIAKRHRLPLLATTPTRRANRERIERAGCDAALNARNVAFLREVQAESGAEMYVGGLMGCKGDAYSGADGLTAAQAAAFHGWQAEQFRAAGADLLYAGIMPALPEAVGMAQAMGATGLPYLISFTIQADGRLLDGTAISDAIAAIDELSPPPVCYMTNCVYPGIVTEALMQPFNQNERVQSRFLGIQANTSALPYAMLDQSVDLHTAEPEQFAADMHALRAVSRIKIFGGCCGTDGRHMELVAAGLNR